MQVKLNDLQLTTKFSIIFAALCLFSFSSYLLVYYCSVQQKSDVTLVDIAGRNRMLSQRIAAMAALTRSSDESLTQLAKEKLRQALLLHEQSIHALKKGGLAPGIQEPVFLPAATTLVEPKIKEVEACFEEHKKLASILLEEPAYLKNSIQIGSDSSKPLAATHLENPLFAKAFTGLQQHLLEGSLLERNVELTELFAWQSGQRQESFFNLLVFVLFLNLVVIGFAFLLMKRMLQPLETITGQMQAIAEGFTPDPLQISNANEWGQMATAINRLTNNLTNAADFAKNVGEGKFDTNMAVFDHKGELAEALYKMRDNLYHISEEDKKRNWAAQGLAKFSEILRSTADIKTLGDQIICNLVKYLKANQGSLFVLNDRQKDHLQLEMLSCYAFDRKKFLEKQVLVGEGMVGQAYLEKETIYLLEIPDTYLKINSGLGEANPKALLIVPLKVEDRVFGVIELAAFTHFEPHHIAFVEKIAENIAATLATVKTNEQTKYLLEASQQQAEQLQAQEEEMRQNMEELEATQEEMRRNEGAHLQEIHRLEQIYQANTTDLKKKDLEMSGFMEAIDSTLVMIEFDLEGYILTANEQFLDRMGYTLAEIAGKHHRILVESSYNQSNEYAKFWQQLSIGTAQIGEVKRVTKQGKEIWLSASYTPILNEEKKVVKVIKFAQDITDQKYWTLDYQSQLVAISKSNAVIEFDLRGNILSANDNFLRLMNYELQEIIGNHHRIFVEQQEQHSVQYETFWKKLGNGEFIVGEFERVAKGKGKVWIKGSYNPIKDLSGKVYKIVKYAQDVTAQKQLELQAMQHVEELQAQEEEIRQNLESLQSAREEVERKSLELEAQISAVDSSLATIEFNLQGKVLKANENFLRLMGYQLEEVIDQPHLMFVEAGYGKSNEYGKFWQELQTGKAQIGKVKRLTKTGQMVWLNASYTPVLDLNEKPVKIIKLAQVIEGEG